MSFRSLVVLFLVIVLFLILFMLTSLISLFFGNSIGTLFIILVCILFYTQRSRILKEYKKLKKDITLKSFAKEYESEQYESFDNIQKAGQNLKNIVKFLLYQIICSLLTTAIAAISITKREEEFGIGVIIVGGIISIYFTFKMFTSLLKAGNFLINHKTD